MPSYIYKAKKDAVNAITGQINAQNEEDALEMIHQLGLIPVSIEESNAEGVLFSDIREVKIKTKELYLFSKQLANLLKSGVSLLKALGSFIRTNQKYLFCQGFRRNIDRCQKRAFFFSLPFGLSGYFFAVVRGHGARR